MLQQTIRIVLLAFALGFTFSASHARGEMVFEVSTPGTFIDISGTGTALSTGDDTTLTVTSNFLGSQMRVGNNGGVAFGSSGNLHWSNQNLPNSLAFGSAEAFLPFWDDLDSESGTVYIQDFSDRFVIQWDEMNHYPGNQARTQGITFQAQIFSRAADAAGGDIVAQFLYLDTTFANNQSQWNDGISATIGWQFGSEAMVYSFNTASVSAGTVLTLRSVPEPTTFAMFAVTGMALFRRNRKNQP